MKKLRILHAPALVVNQQWIVSRAQRKLGHVSDVMTFNSGRKEFLVRSCDIDFHFDRKDISLKPQKILPTLAFITRFTLFFIKALFKYDIFHFHSESFFGSYSDIDLRILRLFRKKIIFQYFGCDIRLKSHSILQGEPCICTDCVRVCQQSRKMRDSLTHLRYADFRIYGGSDVIELVPDAEFLPLSVDLDYWKTVPVSEIPKEHRLQDTGNVRVLQAFENAKSRGDQKGTRFIKAAIEQLKREGVKVDYVFLERVPHDCMKYYYQQADIVIDQLMSAGWHGSITVEAMSMGKPIVCNISENGLKFLPKDHPIVVANPDNLAEKLRMLINDKALRDELGKKGRRYIEKYHDAMKVAKDYLDLYQKDWR